MTAVVTFLYALVPIISTIGWIPQIVRLTRQPALAAGMSVGTWAVWTFTGLVGTLYGAVVISDLLVTVTFLANFLGQATVLTFAVTARLRARNPQERHFDGNPAHASTTD